jgi:hypothetical protein
MKEAKELAMKEAREKLLKAKHLSEDLLDAKHRSSNNGRPDHSEEQGRPALPPRHSSISVDTNDAETMQPLSKTESNAVDDTLERIRPVLPPRHSSTVPVNANKSSSSSLHVRSNSNPTTRPEPRVLHGWTLTSEITFRDVCKTIRETAFVTTNLPLIVSLEVHCSLEQQEIMVDIMKEEWAGFLIDEAHPMCDPAERLPRLDELFNKVGLLG